MSKEYKDVMNKITMDKDMKKRLLFNLENINEEKADSFKLKIMHGNFRKNIGMLAACCMVIICCIANQPFINFLSFRDTNSHSLELSQDTDSSQSNPDVSLKDKDSTSIEKAPPVENSTNKNSTASKNGSLSSKKTFENAQVQKSYSKSTQNDINSSQKDLQSQDMTSNVQNDNSQTNNLNNNENLSKKIDDNNLNKKSINIDQSPMIAKSSIEDFNNLSDLKKSVDFEFKIPQILPKDFSFKNARLISQQSISITYVNNNDNIEFVTTKENNIASNTLEKYEVEKIVNLKIGDITLKGSNKLIHLVTWIQDGMSYCISAPNGLGEDEALNMVKSISVYK